MKFRVLILNLFIYKNFTFRELTTVLKNIIHDSINKSFLIIPQLLFIYVLLCCHSFIQPLWISSGPLEK